jgi:putative ABC transport system permease protein
MVGGFTFEIDQTVAAVGAQAWVLPANADGRVAADVVFPAAEAAAVRAERGVTRADPLAIIPSQDAHVDGHSVTVNVIGVQRGGLGDPVATSGHPLSGQGQVVVDGRSGATVGSQLAVGASHFLVVGVVHNRTLLGGLPNVYMSLHDAQHLALGGRPLATAVVTSGVPAHVGAGLVVLTPAQVETDTQSAMAGAMKSINDSKYLMWVVAAFIIAALLYVAALQRTKDFAVLKALGSSSAALFGSLALQAVVVTLAAAVVATIASRFMGGILAQPVDIPASAYYTLPAVAIFVGLLASLVGLRRATGADPAAAFGG